jgi:hypothetical protein
MSQEVLTVAQLFSIVLAACGTPGLTFWVMKKMSREALSQIKENCKTCRAHLDEKIDNLDDTVHEAIGRQLTLRERLPIDYVRRDEFNRHLNGRKESK